MKNTKETTKQKIIEAAIKLISANGFNATTTALIAKEAGFSEAIIYKYYRDKQSLLREIAKKAIDRIIENIAIVPLLKNIELSKEYPPKEFIKSILMERLEFVAKNIELIRILLMEIQYNEDLFLLAQKTIFEEINIILEGILETLSEKLGITETKARAIARLGIGLMGSIIIQKYFLMMDFKPGEMETEINTALDIIFANI